MKYKSDWPEAQRRLTALWRGQRLDRPCIAVCAPQPDPESPPAPEPADNEARWTDPDYLVASARHQLRNTWWGGEAIPSCLLMAGWVICLGGKPNFAPETIWFDTREVDFDKPSPFRHDANCIWARKYRDILVALCQEAGRDDFLLGQTLGLPANDLLSMQMGTESYMLALMDRPDWMVEAVVRGACDQLHALHEQQALIRSQGHEFWYGNAGWMPFWAPDPFVSTQSDVSCMLSPSMYDRFVMPEMELYGGECGAVWYHLDGGDARQHLPRLLSLPYLRVVQYTPAPSEPPNGPEHLAMYKQIQAAGKIVHIELPHENIEPLVRELDPARLMLHTWCPSREVGETLLEQAVKWTKVHHGDVHPA